MKKKKAKEMWEKFVRIVENSVNLDEALQKQVPMKALKYDINPNNQFCPACDWWVKYDDLQKGETRIYCPDCGQLIDLED